MMGTGLTFREMLVGRLSTYFGISRATIGVVAVALIGAVATGATLLVLGVAYVRKRRRESGTQEIEVVATETLNHGSETSVATKQGTNHQ